MESATYDPNYDEPRLTNQRSRVLEVLETAEGPLTLGEIQDVIRERFGVRDGEASISARIRDLRRIHGHEISRDFRGDRRAGCWEYRLREAEEGAA